MYHTKRYNRYPDEKGTESGYEIGIEGSTIRYNRYPDEKGTESLFNPPIPPCQGGITTAIPMKRGLKGNFAPLSILALMSSRLQSLTRLKGD